MVLYGKNKKTSEDEMNRWRKQYPSTTASRRIDGDVGYGAMFRGEGNKLLYELKNHMKLGNLDQLRMTRIFTDGTIVTAWSFFGQDFIKIDTTNVVVSGITAAVVDQTCIITFVDFPLYVPPMKNPGRILEEEVQGVDYFKSYYTLDTSKCPKCNDIGWEFLFRYLQSSPLSPLPVPPLPISTRIEWPVESLHHEQKDPVTGVMTDHPIDKSDHTIYSLEPPAWGQIISRGTDSGGTYIIWKAYTESINISRTGLAIMRLVARIRDNTGKEICAQNERIEVDCCLKNVRPVEIWWEDFGTCQPFIPYQGVLYNAICKMPTEVSYGGTSGLVWYGCTRPQQPLYAIPEKNGSCLPVEWTLTGPISLWNSDKNDNIIFFKCSEAACNEGASITLRDRCGTEYVVRAAPCCEEAKPLSIKYTFLSMSCGGSQDFTSDGGCGPYVWSATSGTIDQTGHYHAPATNANCANNPTITVTDCCGSSASIELAVNCFTAATPVALGFADFTLCWCRDYDNCNNCGYCTRGCGIWESSGWSCDGVLQNSCKSRDSCSSCAAPPSCGSYTETTNCGAGLSSPNTGNEPCCSSSDCYTGQCGCGGPGSSCPCGSLKDWRTQVMKDGGCCPLNPFTGLPYIP